MTVNERLNASELMDDSDDIVANKESELTQSILLIVGLTEESTATILQMAKQKF